MAGTANARRLQKNREESSSTERSGKEGKERETSRFEYEVTKGKSETGKESYLTANP